MKLRKHISRLLVLGILTNNIYFNSSANTEIPNRYQTLEGEYITIDDSKVGELHEIEIFGNTVQDENDLEDIQSVGDLYVDENGNPILDSQGRMQYYLEIISANSYNYFDKNNITQEGADYISNIFTEVKEGEVWTLTGYSSEGWLKLQTFDKEKNIISNAFGNIQSNKLTVTIPKDIKYIKPVYSELAMREAMLVRGEKALEYQDYVQIVKNKTIILLPTQLQKVGDVADRLYWDNEKGRYVIEKKVYHNLMDLDDSYNTYHANWFTVANNPNNSRDSKFIITGNDGFIQGITTYGQEAWVYIHCNEEYLMKNNISNDTSSLSNYAKNKGVYGFYYEVKTPQLIETNITSKIKVPTYENKTHIYIDTENGIKPTLKVTVDKIEGAAQEAVDIVESMESNDTLTISTFSLARSLVNQMEESLLKDQLQAKLNNISSLNDLTLERKNISANLDVYIKSESMLSMSLDTNSVTFEGYSGAEPMEKQSAINITINSSLPYNLNAYIPSEISSSNGNNQMDLAVFNIKEGAETEYKQFENTNDKIVLKETCESGNNINHSIDLKLDSNNAYVPDVYKTTIKFEAVQK